MDGQEIFDCRLVAWGTEEEAGDGAGRGTCPRAAVEGGGGDFRESPLPLGGAARGVE